jgi:AraC-like DNA-binding protein
MSRSEPKVKPERPPATFVSYDPEAYGAIVHPNRFDWYLVTRWLPDLGNDALAVIKVLRNELYYNPDKKALRDECEMSMEELARRSNMSRTRLFKLFRTNAALNAFVERQPQVKVKDDRPHRDVNAFRVCMTDPIHPDDEEEYQRLLEQRGAERLAASMRPKFRVKGDDPYEYAGRTHRTPMSARSAEQEYAARTHMGDMSARGALHNDQILPPDLLTKELTPAAAPSHKCVPPEGEEKSSPPRSIDRPENQRGLALVREALKQKRGKAAPGDLAEEHEQVHDEIAASLEQGKR